MSAAGQDSATEADPFRSSLDIWEHKLRSDLSEPAWNQQEKLRLLTEHTKDIEILLFGCTKDILFELSECVAFGLLDRSDANTEREWVYQRAEQELSRSKAQLLVALADEQDLTAEYRSMLEEPGNEVITDYERLGDLGFALVALRANLRRDLTLAGNGANVTDAQRGAVRRALEQGSSAIDTCVAASATALARQERMMLRHRGGSGGLQLLLNNEAALEQARGQLMDSVKAVYEEFGSGAGDLADVFEEEWFKT